MTELDPLPSASELPSLTSDSAPVAAVPAENLSVPPAAPQTEPAPPFSRPRPTLSWKALLVDVFLVALIAIGVYFRFSWVNWNQDTDIHPDEYGLTGTLTRLSIPKSLGDYFNTRLSSLSPYQKYDLSGTPTDAGPDNRMRWGQWPIILIRMGAELAHKTDYGNLRLFGRQLSALADTLALLVLYLIGRRLYGHRVGLLASALGALAVMQIQQSHFMTVDNFAVLFTTVALYGAVRAAQRGGWKWYAFFGIFFGMAVASRINLVLLFAEIVVAAAVAHFGPQAEAGPGEALAPRRNSLWTVMWLLALAGVVSLATFRVTQPMAFRAANGNTTLFTLNPNPEWVESMKVAASESSGVGGGPPGEQWTNRPALVFPFVNMVIWGMGVPLGLMGWAGLLWAAWKVARSKMWAEWSVHLVPLTWAGGWFLFMGTRWVKSIRYFLPIYPFVILFAAWAIVELWQQGQAHRKKEESERTKEAGSRKPVSSLLPSPYFLLAGVCFVVVTLSTLAWAWGFTNIYRHDNTRVQASRWIYQNVPAPFNLHLTTPDGPYTEPLPAPAGMQISADVPYRIEFRSHVTGTLQAFSVGHASNINGEAARLHVVLAADPEGNRALAQAEVTIAPPAQDPRGDSASANLPAATLEKGQTYYLLITVLQGEPVGVTGTTVSNEDWDEGLPLRIDNRDGFGGLYNGLTMNVRWMDDENKRQMYLANLEQVDYIILPSQRGLWSASRLPNNYPMTMAYYQALFNGQLGFELAAEFQTPIRIGPLQFSDVAGTWAWGQLPKLNPDANDPFNNNLLAAEEAFSVYDHAPVWIFRKRPDFNMDRVREFFSAMDLGHVVNQDPHAATLAPTLLMLPPDVWAQQQAGGTWSQMFNPESWLNKVEPLGVLVWWLAVLLVGWLAFPLTFLALGSLPDRGYAFAKIVGLLVVAWLVWITGSLRLLPFTRLTVALGFLALALGSSLAYARRRAEINAFVRRNWRYCLTLETLFLALFIFDLLIRLGNPDLWHPAFGGEKPMVFSYFNAVLKSTYFPPYDPWLAGGYLNYYYYGWVVVGLLVKLLGIVPSFAYNLILPTLLALTGTGAFGVAYNLVKAQTLKPDEAENQAAPVQAVPLAVNAEGTLPAAAAENLLPAEGAPAAPPAIVKKRPLPNPYLAGVAAALLIVVLGNLAQVGVVANALQRASDQAFKGMGDFNLTALLQGTARVVTGKTTLPIGTGNWYWDATRIVDSYIHQSEITEFPFFTFLYADLHAHMMDLPVEALAIAWAVACMLGAARRSSKLETGAFLALGGLVLGVTRAINTWDFPTYLALGVVAVLAAQFWHEPRLTRDNLVSLGVRLGVVLGLALLLYMPYDRWFDPPLSKVELFKGVKTTLEPYLSIYGLFLFILGTFLVWETRRWLAETPAAVVAQAETWAFPALAVLLAFAVSLGVWLYLKVHIAWVAWSLMAWAGLLLLRGRSRLSIEKRTVLFLLGTGLALTLFVDMLTVGGDRMNTIFKLYMQVWVLFSVAAAAALAWVWAEMPAWSPRWQTGWTIVLALLVTSTALYTVTAASAKIRDRFPQYTAQPYGVQNPACQEIPTVPMPYANDQALAVKDQPHSLDGMAYLTWSAYCDRTYFLPLTYDYDAIRWMQDHVTGSPVIAEAQSFDLYRMSSRYAWYTGLPDVVGWDWHQRQERGAAPTEFITQRGQEVTSFFLTPDPDSALTFLQKYRVRYVIVGPMELAYYRDSGGLGKFDTMTAQGQLAVAYRNPGVTIYEVKSQGTGY